MKWINCDTCDEEFRVISESLSHVVFCPFCGTDIEYEEDEEDEE